MIFFLTFAIVMLERIKDIDTLFFYYVNSSRCYAADWIFALLSAHFFIGLVVAAFALYLIFVRFKRRWWVLVIMIALCFLLADRVSVMCFKDVFCRLRPSHALTDSVICKLQHFQLVYDNRGGLYGFVSSHATNAFCITTLFCCLMKNKYLKILMLIWVFLVCYSRIYCGYHYPLDVICGALVGIVLGFIIAFCFQYANRHHLLLQD
jgi:undecaprenyl-diphosphatase